MTAAEAAPADDSAVESLKRVRATETDWASRLADLKRRTEEELHRLAAETEAALEGARRTGEADRDGRVARARAEADREAAAIVAAARADVARIAGAPADRLEDRAEALLDAVLKEFRRARAAGE